MVKPKFRNTENIEAQMSYSNAIFVLLPWKLLDIFKK